MFPVSSVAAYNERMAMQTTFSLEEIEKCRRYFERQIRHNFRHRNHTTGNRQWIRHCIAKIREWDRIEREQEGVH